ncbi:MAG TPA: PrsW family intramembrane metalloprotease [Dermatophilaceae bacterium]|nr:PrsW family intramembrane metalloprotease [Dermatophilaceae bacterium]
MTGRRLLRRWLLAAVMLLGFGVCALVLAATIGVETGGQNALLALLVAALPLGVVLPCFLWLDRFEAEPAGLLLMALAWGALVASTVALLLNTGSLVLLREVVQQPMTVGPVVVAPVVEESVKGLGVLLILLFRGREFDGIVDGLVYAGVVAAGFAFAENVLYLGRALGEGGESLAVVFFLRGVVGPFAHPLFTICTGIGLGVAAGSRRAAVRVGAPTLGLLLAMALHAMWNLSTVTGLRGFFSLYVVLQLPVFLAAVGLAVWARRREGHLIAVHLTPYADAGWLDDHDLDMLGSMSARRRALAWARSTGGRPGLEAMRGFQDAASELAMLRMRAVRGAAHGPTGPEEHRLLGVLVTQRARLAGQRQG